MNNVIRLSTVFLSLSVLSYGDDLKDFETLLDDVSDIATKKSINVDYLPSVVSVINAETLRLAGVQNLSEALDMLPGFQVQLSPMGFPMTTVRGLKNPNAYLSDKIKVMIDGVAVKNEITGSSYFSMDFPLDLVEKIEVLRGPGSTMYGAGAFYATINVITKLGNSKEEKQLSLAAGSYKYKYIGTNFDLGGEQWKFFADGYYKQNDKSLYFDAEDGYTDEGMKDYSVGFKAVNGNFEFITRLKNSTYGNFYSFEGQLNPIPQQDEWHINKYFLSQLSYKTDLNNYQIDTKVNFSNRTLDQKANIDSIAGIEGRFNVVGIVVKDGFVMHEKSGEQNFGFDTMLTLPKLGMHDIHFGVGAEHTKITKNDMFSTVEEAILLNIDDILAHPNYGSFRYREAKEPAFWHDLSRRLVKKTGRTNIYGYFQDLISVNENTDIVVGLRTDNYSDFGNMLSKRAGIVYRADKRFIFKLLYGSAFRAPTFIEAYAYGHINNRAGYDKIKPEETDTYEAVFIYAPNFNNKLSINFYYSDLKNIIDLEENPETIPGYINYDHRTTKGFEVEYNFKSGITHNLYLNASYIDATYTIPDEPTADQYMMNQSMPDISKVMLKGIYVYTPTSSLSFGTTWRYFSKTTSTQLQWVLDEADLYDPTARAVHIFDQSVNYKFSKDNQITFTVKNLFNADVRHPAYYYYTADGGIKREGRNYMVNYTYRF